MILRARDKWAKKDKGRLNTDRFHPPKERSWLRTCFWAVEIDEMLFMKAVQEDTVFEAFGSG